MKQTDAKPKTASREAVAKSMRRIVCQFPNNPDPKGYFEAVYEQVKLREIPADLFEAACVRLVGTMQPYKPPIANEYVDAAKSAKFERNRRRENCSECQGRGWIYVRDLRDQSAPLLQSPVNQSEIKPGDKVAVATCQACKPMVTA